MIILMIDPERITERVFGGPHFAMMQVVRRSPGIVRHPRSGRVYTMDEAAVAAWESRSARPAIYAGPMAGLPWRMPVVAE